jgi:ketosteroid isomerase-like protein
MNKLNTNFTDIYIYHIDDYQIIKLLKYVNTLHYPFFPLFFLHTN